jgi:chemotaxis protein histidine kinase CheA
MNEITARTPEIIGAEIRDITAQVRRVALGAAIEIGHRLDEAKEMLPHGEWSGWLERETEFSQRQAQRMMQLYDAYGAAQIGIFGAEIKATALSDLSITNALLLVAIPENEREEFAAEVDAEHISSRELEQAIRERDELKKQLEAEREAGEGSAMTIAELQSRADEAEAKRAAAAQQAQTLCETSDRLRAELRELESRPRDVAVQEPDPEEMQAAIDEAVDKARKEAAEATEKALADARTAAAKDSAALAEKLAKAERTAEKAQKAAEAAKNDGTADALKTELAAAQAEAERLKKQLAMSDEKMTSFKLKFDEVQNIFYDCFSILSKIHGDQQQKCQAAMKALLAEMGDRLEKLA